MTEPVPIGGVRPDGGWVPVIGRGGSAWTTGGAPYRCPGCPGVAGFHCWVCPVLVRLSAQLLAGCPQPVEGWRDRAMMLSLTPADPFDAEAVHWRKVAAAPDPDPVTTPDLVPVFAGGGLREVRPGDAPCNFPPCLSFLELIENGPLGDKLNSVSPGWSVVPFAFLVPGDPSPYPHYRPDDPAAENPFDDADYPPHDPGDWAY